MTSVASLHAVGGPGQPNGENVDGWLALELRVLERSVPMTPEVVAEDDAIPLWSVIDERDVDVRNACI